MSLLVLAAGAAGAAGTAAAGAPEAETGDAFMIGVAVVFLIVAIGLFFLELLMPSFGIITLAGITCAVVSLAAAFGVSRLVGVVFVAVVLVLIPLLVYVGIKVVRRTGLVLRPEDTPGVQSGTGGAGRKLPGAGEGALGSRERGGSDKEAALAPGARGVSLTVLRPSGTASFDGRRASVVTTGEMVESGAQIEVVRVEGTRTVVRPVRV